MTWHYASDSESKLGPSPKDLRQKPARNCRKPVKDYKRQTSAQVLWALRLAAAARITSLSDAGQRLRDAPSDETARQALVATLPDDATLQRQLNAALAGHWPKASANAFRGWPSTGP